MAQYRRDLFCITEAALVGLFFVQAVRFLFGALYAHVNSADLVLHTLNAQSILGQPGVINVADAQIELIAAIIALFVPFLGIIFSRLWFGPTIAAIIVAAGRVFMTANGATMLGVLGAVITAAAAGLYMATIAVRRSGSLPILFIGGFALDQLIRLYGDTRDITLDAAFLTNQTIFSLALFLIAVLAAVFERIARRPNEPLQRGEISGWGAFSLGGLLFLEFAILGLPNLLAHRAEVNYASVAPWLLVVTLLPLIPDVREFARRFLGIFDTNYRGWVWCLLIGLLFVIGFRFNGFVSSIVLLLTQLLITLSWWWVVQPASGRLNFTAPGITFGTIVFLLLAAADFLTYEYVLVRDIPEPVGPILRAFRGLGLVVTLLAVLLASFPAILARKRIPWRGGNLVATFGALALVMIGGVLAASMAGPVVIRTVADPSRIRIVSLNLNDGYSLYYGSDLPEVGFQLKKNGADVVLLQGVDTGRLTSYSVDQAEWLGRYLEMQVVYFSTSEAQHGLAILSRIKIDPQDIVARLLTSPGRQTGVQSVRLNLPTRSTLDIYNTELSPVYAGTPDQILAQQNDQKRQIQEIFALLDERKSPTGKIIIGGTFNHLPNTEIYQFMEQQGYSDPLKERPIEKAVTLHLPNNLPVRADYIWLAQSVIPKGIDVASLPQSTHDIVVVEIETPQAQ